MSLANLQTLFSKADADDRAEGELAYARYNLVMRMFADHYGVPVDRATAAFVALSPNNDYFGNLRSLASVLEGIRAGTPVQDITVSTYKHCRDRAYAYATGQEPFDVPTRGLKTLSFYHNILDPSHRGYVTVDGHMVCAYHGKHQTMKDAKVRGRQHYEMIRLATCELAHDAGLIPNQAQAIIWFARKRIFNVKYDPQLNLFGSADDRWNTVVLPTEARPYTRKAA